MAPTPSRSPSPSFLLFHLPATRFSRIELRALLSAALQLFTQRNRLVPSEALPHIHHSALALAVATLELLTSGWKGLE